MKNIGKILTVLILLGCLGSVSAREARYPMQGVGSLLFCGGYAANMAVKKKGGESSLKEVYAWAKRNHRSTKKWQRRDIKDYLEYKGFLTPKVSPKTKLKVGDIVLLPNVPFVIGHWITVVAVEGNGTVVIYDSMGENGKPLHRQSNRMRRYSIIRPIHKKTR